MEYLMQTAVLSGDNTKELRVFALEDLSVQQELGLTQHLCSMMNKYQQHWEG